ncbi:MAG: XDD4 family exosortase-dependent surface protein [Planctomycetia bacterium]|jgi:hypothetical protein
MRFLAFLSRSLLFSTIASALAVAAVACAPRPAAGGTIFTASGTSRLGNPVAFQAELTMTGNDLQIVLDNLSPKDTTDADDVLTSFYFDIWNGKERPTLTYESASGFVFQVNKGPSNDIAVYYTPPMPPVPATDKESNLVAQHRGDATWQFLEMDTRYDPGLGFGIGTVANGDLKPNGFAPAVVGPPGNEFINFGIYRTTDGDIDPSGVLNKKYLVQNRATFNFTGVKGYTQRDIRPKAVFGLGTGPDSILVVPEQSTIVLAASGLVLAALASGLRRSRRGRRKRDEHLARVFEGHREKPSAAAAARWAS